MAVQLTEVQCLTTDWSESDVKEIAAVKQSTVTSSPSAQLRFGAVDPVEAEEWWRRTTALSLVAEFKMPRIVPLITEPNPPLVPHAEHLVVRDLDLAHLGPAAADSLPGRVVAHADWRFLPSFGAEAEDVGGVDTINPDASFPAGVRLDLQLKINSMVHRTLKDAFSGLACFELQGISTLSPSHLRKGIAKRLTQWVFPYADQFSLPVILAASPVGLHLYQACGFEEYREFDIVIDLVNFGGEGIHRHVIMVRWPDNIDQLPPAWQEWRITHGTRL